MTDLGKYWQYFKEKRKIKNVQYIYIFVKHAFIT